MPPRPAPASEAPDASSSSPPRAPRGSAFSSIERQLPLLLCLVFAPVITVLVLWSYVELRETLITSASGRFESGARRIALLLTENALAFDAQARQIAALPAMREAIEQPGEAYEAAARRSFETVFRAGTASAVGELWTIDGTRVAVANHASAGGLALAAELQSYASAPPESVGVMRIGSVGSTVFLEVVAEVLVRAPTPALIGHVVLRRSMSGNRNQVDLLMGFIGSGVTLRVGNRDGTGWNDLDHPAPAPPVDPLDPERRFHRVADGSNRIGAGVEVEGAPWVVWVESAAGDVLAPARSSAIRMAIVSGVLLVLGVAGAWAAGRRITAPLRDAIHAAEGIAAGRLDGRLAARGPAEVRRLGDAFNAMAEHVERSQRELEQRVDARTADLKEALRQLHDAQDSLVRKERLATLGQLAGSVGHELRNPLGVMTNAIYYLEMILDAAPDEVREYLGILRHQIHLSEKIISDLLDFARLRPPQSKAVKVDDLLDEQVARLGPFAGTIERAIPADLAPAWADPVQAGQVVYNLLTNAVQAMGDAGGTLTLRGAAADARRVRIEVADTGPGVPVELRDKIFEPLFTTRARGIGLGLAVSRRLAENNGGELRLEPARDGAGATFSLLLPIAAGEGR